MLDVRRLAPAAAIQTVFDIGANVGHCTRSFCDEFPHAEVLAFEPEQANFNALQSAIEELPRAHGFHFALGSEKMTCELHVQADSQWHSLVPEKNRSYASAPPPQQINVETLDGFCNERDIAKIDVLKTDTEGFDLEVLKGAQQLLKAGGISFILTEVGFNPQDKAHTFFPDLLSFLTPLQYEFYDLYDRPAMRNEGKPRMGYCNALFVHTEI